MPVDSYWINQQKKPIEQRVAEVLKEGSFFPWQTKEITDLLDELKKKVGAMEGEIVSTRLTAMIETDFD